jgi:hypothetical protein
LRYSGWQNIEKPLVEVILHAWRGLMFKVNEIKSWAKKNGYVVKKQGDGYVWFLEGEEPSEPKSIDSVVTEIFNKITNNKFVEYQKSYAANRDQAITKFL